MIKKVRFRRKSGDVFSVPLGNNKYGFGHVLTEPLMAFYDMESTNTSEDIDLICSKPVLFRIWVMNSAITGGIWPVIGSSLLSAQLNSNPRFFKWDIIAERLFITTDGGDEIPATLEECQNLECAAVWEPEHVEERLRDHFAGRRNKWVDSLQPPIKN